MGKSIVFMRKKLLAVLLAAIMMLTPTMGQYCNGESLDDEDGETVGSFFDLFVTVATGVLSLVLFFISATAYRHEARGRLLYVMGAFSLFALKSVTIALDDLFNRGLLTGPLVEQIHPISSLFVPLSRVLDFGILLLFFFGLVSKK